VESLRSSNLNGIEEALQDHGIDIITGPSTNRTATIVACADSPLGTLPLGYAEFNGRPFGLPVIVKFGRGGSKGVGGDGGREEATADLKWNHEIGEQVSVWYKNMNYYCSGFIRWCQ
jgi:hypothetical protein